MGDKRVSLRLGDKAGACGWALNEGNIKPEAPAKGDKRNNGALQMFNAQPEAPAGAINAYLSGWG